MNRSIRHGLKICFTIVGTNIGAGFASGREIWEFFSQYGPRSTLYVLLSIGLFSVCGMIVMWISWKQQTDHYYSLLTLIMGKRMAACFDGLILLYLISSTLIMFAGSGATFSAWHLPHVLGALVLAFAVWLILFKDVSGLMSLNTALMPCLTAALVVICVTFIAGGGPQPPAPMQWEGLPVWPAAVTYAAVNMIPLMAVLATLGKEIRRFAEIAIAGIGSAVCLGGVAVLFHLALLRVAHLANDYDILLFALIDSYSPVWSLSISVLLWLAIYTTAVSSLHGAVYRISAWTALPRWGIALAIVAAIVPLSQFGFAALVKMIYPLYGLLNLFVLFAILLYPLARVR